MAIVIVVSSLCLSVRPSVCEASPRLMKRIVGIRYERPTTKLCEQVNMNCPLGTQFCNFQPLQRPHPPKLPNLLNHKRWCHLENKFKAC